MQAMMTSALVSGFDFRQFGRAHRPHERNHRTLTIIPGALQGRVWGYPGNCQFTTYQLMPLDRIPAPMLTVGRIPRFALQISCLGCYR